MRTTQMRFANDWEHPLDFGCSTKRGKEAALSFNTA